MLYHEDATPEATTLINRDGSFNSVLEIQIQDRAATLLWAAGGCIRVSGYILS